MVGFPIAVEVKREHTFVDDEEGLKYKYTEARC